jgi:hypothetical protein
MPVCEHKIDKNQIMSLGAGTNILISAISRSMSRDSAKKSECGLNLRVLDQLDFPTTDYWTACELEPLKLLVPSVCVKRRYVGNGKRRPSDATLESRRGTRHD